MTIDLLAIIGQTAGGKSSLALKIANQISAEIIAADSKTIYKNLDIGTAKPTLGDQKLVKHHLLDLIEINQTFNVAQFQKHAQEAINKIHKRDKLPILVGGSGLYVDSILCNYNFNASQGAQPKLRQRLEQLTIVQLQDQINRQGLVMPSNKLNRRYLIRSLERGRINKKVQSWRANTLAVGLKHDRAVLRERIEQRLEEMLKKGLLQEARLVFENCSNNKEAAKGNIYAALRPYFEQKIELKDALDDFIQRDLALAKKQITWFKRHSQIIWFDNLKSAETYILKKLENKSK